VCVIAWEYLQYLLISPLQCETDCSGIPLAAGWNLSSSSHNLVCKFIGILADSSQLILSNENAYAKFVTYFYSFTLSSGFGMWTAQKGMIHIISVLGHPYL
jgi:hypothetical protein